MKQHALKSVCIQLVSDTRKRVNVNETCGFYSTELMN